jgi:hypothetical protein
MLVLCFPCSGNVRETFQIKGKEHLSLDLCHCCPQYEMSVNTILVKLTRVCCSNIQVRLYGDQLVVIAKSLCV